jgi:hypothetical protein
MRAYGGEMPKNGDAPWEHYLDCAVIRRFHEILEAAGESPVDTIRGFFQEDPALYEGSYFRQKTHVQIAVVNPDCIKAVFRVTSK